MSASDTSQLVAAPLVSAPIALGMMRLTDYEPLHNAHTLADWIEARLDQGLNWFDHADIYGDQRCETLFGSALAVRPELKKRLKLISKADIVMPERDASRWRVKHYDTSANYLRDSVEGSLRRLNAEQLDLFLIHRPDPLMDVESVARELESLLADGKIADVGVSNFLPDQWRLLNRYLGNRLRCNQIELSLRCSTSLFNGDAEALQQDGMQILAWSPLAGGQLESGDLGACLAEMSEYYGCSAVALAIAWLRRIPSLPVPVLGSLNEQRIADALVGCSIKLSRGDWFALLEAARGHPVA